MRIKTTSNLPNWFSLSNYIQINELDNNKCWEQVKKRFYLREFLLDNIKYGNFEHSEDCAYLWRAITEKNVILGKAEEYMTPEEVEEDRKWSESLVEQGDQGRTKWQLEQSKQIDIALDKKVSISGSAAISGIRVDMIDAISSRFRERGLIFDQEDGSYEIKAELMFSDINLGSKMFDIDLWGGDSVFIRIDLDKRKDSEILGEIESLLPLWRQEMEIGEPDRIKAKPSLFSRIKSYQVIPYLDLLIWSLSENTVIPSSVYAAALFPTGERGDTDFRQTIKKYVCELLRFYEENID